MEQLAEKIFGLEPSAAIDVHFYSMGFKTSEAVLNMNVQLTAFLLLAVILNLIHISRILSGTSESGNTVVAFFKKLQISTMILETLEWCLPFVALNCCISVY